MKKSLYTGITYPSFLGWRVWGELVLRLWKKFLCVKNIHLFDEVRSDVDHYLHCDACELDIHIAQIETREERRVGCAICGSFMPEAGDAIDAGWIPSFWVNSSVPRETGPACPKCASKYLTMDDSETVLRNDWESLVPDIDFKR